MRDSRLWFVGLTALVAALRLVELRISARNERRLRAQGGSERGAGHYPAMVAVHAGMLVAGPLEVFLLDRPLLPPLAASMGAIVAAAMTLRYWAIVTLGARWCTRVIVLPGAPLVRSGPYRFLRHPNYLAVAFEVAALPLVHTAWLTAAVFGGLDLVVLRLRIRVEDAALPRTAADTERKVS